MRSVKTIAIAAIAASALCLGSAAFAQPGNDGFRPDVKCSNSDPSKCQRPGKPGERQEFGKQGPRPEGNFDKNGKRPEPPKDGKGPNGKRPDGNFNQNGKRPEPPRNAKGGKQDANPHDGRFHEYPREPKRDQK